MKKLLYILALILGATAIVACQEKSDEIGEYDNWKPRNETFFRDTLAYANRQVTAAKAQWGDAWEAHCDWRVYPSYRLAEGGKSTWEDSIAVHVVTHGTGSGCPLYTDSASVTYAGRLIPTASYSSDRKGDYYNDFPGFVFDHTGASTKVNETLDPRFEQPTTFRVNNLVEGFTTALMHMHIGDYWRVFIPSNLGYGKSGSKEIPGNSTLVFDMRLKGYSRAGAKPGK